MMRLSLPEPPHDASVPLFLVAAAVGGSMHASPAPAVSNSSPAHAARRSSTPDDIKAVEGVVRERFCNVDTVPDGHLARVTFDFDFIEGGKVFNHGVEAWRVVWSSKGAPK